LDQSGKRVSEGPGDSEVSPEEAITFLYADLELKEKVLAKVRPHNSKAGRYRPGSKLAAFLASL
jgi:hypothetical protein